MSERRWPWHWLRYLFQFSLRTLLVVTTLVAVGCWWWLRPESIDEPLAGNFLKLQRQVRRVASDDKPKLPSLPAINEPEIIDDGTWRIVDLHGDTVVSGRKARGKGAGRWVVYHASGRKAAEGELAANEKTGVWRTWNAAGQLLSETTYKPNQVRAHYGILAWPAARRHGPAKAWHENGQLKLAAEYVDDLPTGGWTEWDAKGAVVAQGRYVAGKREGAWTIRDRETGKRSTVEYIAGRERAERGPLLIRLAEALESPSLPNRLATVLELERLIEAGTILREEAEQEQSLLKRALRSEDDEMRLVALRALVRGTGVSAALADEIEPLAAHPDERIALRAMLARYPHAGPRQGERYDELVQAAEGSKRIDLRIETLHTLARLDAERLPATLPRLAAAIAVQINDTSLGGNPMLALPRELVHNCWNVDVSPITSLKGDLPQLLDQAFQRSDTPARLVLLRASMDLIHESPERKQIPGTSDWTIPAKWQPLIDRGLHDRDPRVREVAQASRWQYGGGFGGGIGGGNGAGGGVF